MKKMQSNNPHSAFRPKRRLLGQILVDGDFIRYQELEIALQNQKNSNKLLGETLVDMGLLDPIDLLAVLSVIEDLASLESAVNLAAGVRRLLGELLLQAKLINGKELELALGVQARTGEKLGKVMTRLGFITEGELDALLQFQKKQEVKAPVPGPLRLGEILVATGQITRDQLDSALEQQRIIGKNIGDVFVESGYITRQQLSHGLTLQNRLLTSALVAILSMAPLSSIHAGSIVMNPESQETSPKLTESIQTHTSLKIVYQISELTITREDILRGYIDVSPGAHIEIQNNNLSGYMVIFKGLGSPVREIVIKGLGKDTLIDSDGGWIVQPYHGRDPLFVELSYRFKLSGDAQPGTYAWPLKIAVSPIIPV